ncbi:MAG: DNA repair protein RadA, partial [Actinobacteria bacterium]|nr:DNA repair protein RadA [Actinomycetota bacterium]
MARTAPKTPSYRCSDCGWTSVKWAGRCGECQAWGTVDEIGATRTRGTTAAKTGTPALPIGSVDLTAAEATATGIS